MKKMLSSLLFCLIACATLAQKEHTQNVYVQSALLKLDSSIIAGSGWMAHAKGCEETFRKTTQSTAKAASEKSYEKCELCKPKKKATSVYWAKAGDHDRKMRYHATEHCEHLEVFDHELPKATAMKKGFVAHDCVK